MATDPWAVAPSSSTQRGFQKPPINNLGDLLDWQRAALHEAIFRKGTSDANREELRKKLASIPTVASLGALSVAPVGPFLVYGAKHYNALPPVLRGVYDATLDTATDPLTLETADLGPLAKGVSKVAGPLIKMAGRIVPLAAVAKAAKSAVRHIPVGAAIEGATEMFNAGGKAIFKYGRSAANTAIGMLNRADAETKEIFRRLQEIDSRSMAGLTPKQTSAVQKIMHGQLPENIVQEIYARDPAVQKAVAGRRDLTDAIARLQEAPFGGVSEAISKLHPGSDTRSIPLFRYQNAPGAAQFSPGRTASFYAMGEPGLADAYKTVGNNIGRGGSHLIRENYIPRKTLDLGDKTGSVGSNIIQKFYGFDRAKAIATSVLKIASGNAGSVEARAADELARELGIKDWAHVSTSELGSSADAMFDRLGAEVARQRGYDSVVMRGKGLGGTDQFMKLYEAGKEPPLTGSSLHPLPKELEPFANRPGSFTSGNVRKNYFPARGQATAVAPDQPAKTVNMIDTFNPHTLPQPEFHIPSKQVQHFEDAFRGMLKTSASNISANRVKAELGEMYGGLDKVPAAIREIFDKNIPATGTEREWRQELGDFVKGVVGLPKIGIVGTTPIHMFNIASLLLIHAPDKLPEALKNFYTILRAGGDPAKRFQAMLPAIEKGIDVATHEKSLGNFFSKSPLNKWTWDWDVAAKDAVANKYIKQGLSPLDAGVRAANDLVNYKNTSPVTSALRWAMPFATFAEGGAKAVFAAIAKHPALVEFENRLTGGRLLGGGNHSTDVMLYQPPANVGRGPLTYLRSKTSDLIKLPAALAVGAIPARGAKSVENWMLSGRTPLGVAGDIVTGPVPYLRDVLNTIPLPGGKTVRGYTPDTPLNAGVFSSTGISLPTKPKTATAPAPVDNSRDPWAVAAPQPGATPAPKTSADPWAVKP